MHDGKSQRDGSCTRDQGGAPRRPASPSVNACASRPSPAPPLLLSAAAASPLAAPAPRSRQLAFARLACGSVVSLRAQYSVGSQESEPGSRQGRGMPGAESAVWQRCSDTPL